MCLPVRLARQRRNIWRNCGPNSASINRFRVVVEEYQTTAQTPEALLRLVEAYLALGLYDEAQTAGAILGYNFKSTPFYEDAFAQQCIN